MWGQFIHIRMGAKSVYFNKDIDEIINKMPQGELSQICQKAVLEHAGRFDSLETAKRNSDKWKLKMEEARAKFNFYEDRYKEFLQIEAQKEENIKKVQEKMKQEEKLEEETEEEKIIEIHKKSLIEHFDITLEVAEKYAKDFMKDKISASEGYPGFVRYFEDKGLRLRTERRGAKENEQKRT